MNLLKDYLEELLDRKQRATIKFRLVDGGVTEIKTQVVKLEEVSGRLIVDTDAGFVIGDDQILEINGRFFENNC